MLRNYASSQGETANEETDPINSEAKNDNETPEEESDIESEDDDKNNTLENKFLKALKNLSVSDATQFLNENQFELRVNPEYVLTVLRSEKKDDGDVLKLELLKLLSNHGACFTIAESTSPGDFPIHLAALYDNVALIEFCASFFLSDPYHITNREGDTPLHVASEYGSVNVINHIKEKIGNDKAFVKMVRLRNRNRLTCFDLAATKFVGLNKTRSKDESSMEYKLRVAKESSEQARRKDAIQKLFSSLDSYFIPVVFYHPDCLDHLAVPTTMQKKLMEEQQLLQQQQQQQQQQEDTVGGGQDGSTEVLPKRKRKSPATDPQEAWEHPDRLVHIMAHLNPLAEEGKLKIVQEFDHVKEETLKLAHSNEYVDFVRNLSTEVSGSSEIVPFTPRVQAAMQKLKKHELKTSASCDTGFSEGTLRAATRAAGSVCAAIDLVLKGDTRRAFCVVRPPGHHAGRNGLLEEGSSCGFCVFNNIMVGAFHALKHTNNSIKKVAIVDLDVHHGNGTEEICREYHNSLPVGSEPQILFLSTHLFDHTPEKQDDEGNSYEFYPGTGEKSDFAHNAFNIPYRALWRRRGTNGETNKSWVERFYQDHWGRSEFRRLVEDRVLPPLRAFHPDLILVSAGFDAALKDVGNARFLSMKQFDGFDLQREDFYWVANEISKIAEICCDGKLVSVLEGGYGRFCKSEPAAPVSTTTTTTTGSSSNNSSTSQQQQTSTSTIASTSTNNNSSNGTNNNNNNSTEEQVRRSSRNYGGTSSSGGGSSVRRGNSNNSQKIDRSVLARNVQGYIEGLCGGSLSQLEKVVMEVDEDEDEISEVEDFIDSSDRREIGDSSDYLLQPEYINSDEALLSGVARRSNRQKRNNRKGGDELTRRSRNKNRNDDEDYEDEGGGGGGRKKRRIDVDKGTSSKEAAMQYLRKVRELPEEEYASFLNIMNLFKAGNLDVPAVIEQIKSLFGTRTDLTLGFNAFLPKNQKIILENGET